LLEAIPPLDSPPRILMADDEEVFLVATADLLRREGFLVDTAVDATEAAEFLCANNYDLLISDIFMPGNHELEFIRSASELNPDLQVILITAFPSVETAVKAIRLPVAAYLTKPVDLEDLLGHIRRIVASVRSHQAIARSKDRLSGWMGDLVRLQEALPHLPPMARDRDAAREVLGLALGNIAGVLMDMKALFEITLEQHPAEKFCTIQSCPRLGDYHQAIVDSIQVLEKTRSAFKSQELGQLRERLEALTRE
jgi:CheY-like chemotaxis protein